MNKSIKLNIDLTFGSDLSIPVKGKTILVTWEVSINLPIALVSKISTGGHR